MLMQDLSNFLKTPPIFYYDNSGANIALASNHVYHARTKHVEIHYHFIREKVIDHGDIQVCFVSSMDKLADIFAKGLSTPRF